MTFENSPTATTPQEPMAKGEFHGKGGELFVIWLLNSILGMLTLGIYFAWGKAKLYRFFYANTEFAGSRFRFTGTGKEIFIGTLKAIGVMFALFAVLVGFQLAAQGLKLKFLGGVGIALFYLAIAVLSQYAIYATMAYRASRARFREIAFRLEGSAWEFTKEALPKLLLGAITLGIMMPFYTHWKIGRIYNNLKYGSLEFAWDADAKEYWRMAIKGFILTVLTLGVYYFFWAPKMYSFIRKHLSVGGCRFHGDFTAGELFMLTLTNMLIVFCTLGLGTPWMMTRSLRFFISRLELENPSRLEAALQVGRQKVGVAGEALGDAMDLGVGLGF